MALPPSPSSAANHDNDDAINKEKKKVAEEDNAAVYWEDWKAYHLSQIVKYFREMRSFPVVGNSAFALLWRNKYLPNPHVQHMLEGLDHEDFRKAAAAIH